MGFALISRRSRRAVCDPTGMLPSTSDKELGKWYTYITWCFFVIIKKLMINTIIGKEQFLIEHNRLSPANLQATFALLTRFQQERKPLLKDPEWSFKLRVPFIIWLGSLPLEKIPHLRKSTKQIFKNYPETKR